jgi:predicted Fe-Mo cluster-binding NifX family protein
MIIAISATGKDIDKKIYSKFERCDRFLIVDLEKNTLLPITNKAKERPCEIGGPVGHLISKVGVDTIITTDIGPRAFEIFKQNEIKIYRAEGIIEDAIKQLEMGKLSEITKATVPRYIDWKKNKSLTKVL